MCDYGVGAGANRPIVIPPSTAGGRMTDEQRTARDLEECVCGDYRWQHEDKHGPCGTCLASSAPWDTCYAFETEMTDARKRIIEKIARMAG